MNSTNRNKIIGGLVGLGVIITFIVLNPMKWPMSWISKNHAPELAENKSKPEDKGSAPAVPAPLPNGAVETQAAAPNPQGIGSAPSPLVTGVKPGLEPQSNAKSDVALTDGCFNLTFIHKKIASHEDGEACLQHKNLIVLNHPDQSKNSKINPKSICMRVNDKPVKFSFVPGKPGQILVGPEAGPHAKITASYCVGKAKCTQSCVPVKDEFLSAIGADDDSELSQTVGWDGQKGKSQEDAEVETQMTALNQDLNADGGENGQIFAGWILESQTAKCDSPGSAGKRVAQAKL